MKICKLKRSNVKYVNYKERNYVKFKLLRNQRQSFIRGGSVMNVILRTSVISPKLASGSCAKGIRSLEKKESIVLSLLYYVRP